MVPDTLRGTNGADNLLGKGWAGKARIGSSAAMSSAPSEATRTWLEVQATMVSKPGVAQTAC